MNEVDEFRKWAAEMNLRAAQRAEVEHQLERARLGTDREGRGCGKLIAPGTNVGAFYTRPSTKHIYFGLRVLCNDCRLPDGADYNSGDVLGELRCGDWIDLSQKEGFVRGKEPPR